MTSNNSRTPRSCPCKNVTWSLSSFTAAEFGDVTALTRALGKKQATSSRQAVPNNNSSSQLQHAYTGGITPLHLAAQHGHVAATWLLLEQGHPVDGGSTEQQRSETTSIAPTDSSLPPSSSSSSSTNNNNSMTCTPLHRAAFSGACATMKLLLEKEANLFIRDKSFGDQKTPLHKAAAGGRYLAVALLLDALRQQQLLSEGLRGLDREQQSPLQVAQYYQRIQEEERQSVARWDIVAGGAADWDQCVSLLEAAGRELGDAKNDANRETISQQKHAGSTIQLPSHRFAEVDCLDCEQNGECVTATWSTAFQKALQQSIVTTSPPVARKTSTTKANQSIDTTIEQVDMEIVTHTNESNSTDEVVDSIPSLVNDGLLNSSSSPSSIGRSCGVCGKNAIVLFPSSSTSDDGCLLVCKKCKPKRRMQHMKNGDRNELAICHNLI